MQRTKIEWTEYSWNPVIGCGKCSPGCLNCYAERMAGRLAAMNVSGYRNIIVTDSPDYKKGNGWAGNTCFVESALDKPLHLKKPQMIFVCSMGDLFHDRVPFEWVDKVMAVVWELYFRESGHLFQFLTKRIGRAKEYFVGRSRKGITDIVYEKFGRRCAIDREAMPENLWPGVSVCTQKEADEKIPILLDIPAAVRFISIEPMLEEMKIDWVWRNHDPIVDTVLDWVIVGPETGPGARPCKIEWIESVVDQCEMASVPCFVKKVPAGKRQSDWGKMDLWPEHLRVREYPK